MRTKVISLSLLKFIIPLLVIYLFAAFQNTQPVKQIQEKRSNIQIEQDTAQANEWMRIGQAFYDSIQYDSALLYSQMALGVFETFSETERDSLWWTKFLICNNQIGRALIKKSEYKKAFEVLNKALEKAKAKFIEEHPDVARIYNNIGIAYYRQGKYDLALTNHQKALDINKKTLDEEHPDVTDTYNNIGNVCLRQGKYDLAMTNYQIALDIKKKTKGDEHPDVARTLYNIGYVYRIQGKYDLAMFNYKKALDIIKKTKGDEHPDVAQINNGIGIVYLHIGKYDLAITNQQKALKIWEKVHGTGYPDATYGYINIGIAYSMQGKYDLAMSNYKKALDITKKTLGTEHPLLAYSYGNIGGAYSMQGKYDLAMPNYKKALDINIKALGDKHSNVAINYNDIGNVYRNQGKYDLSMTNFHKALNINLKTLGNKHPEVARVYNNIGITFESQGNYDLAMSNYKKALKIYQITLGNQHPDVAYVYQDIGLVYKNQGNYDLALINYHKALQSLVEDFNNSDIYMNPSLNRKINSKLILLETLYGKAEIFYQLYLNESQNNEDLEAALTTCNLSIDLVNDMRRGYNWESSKEELLKNAFPIYELSIKANQKMHELSGQDSFLLKAYASFEKSKSILLLESIQDAEAKSFYGLPDSLLEVEYDLNTSLAFYENQLFEEELKKEKADSAFMALCQDKLFYLKQSRDSLLLKFEAAYPDYHRLKYDINTVDVKQVQNEILQQEQALIEYFVGDSSIYMAVITKDEFDVLEIKKDFPLEDWVKTMQQDLFSYHLSNNLSETKYQANADSLIEVSYRLYQKIFEPILAKHKLPEQLIIVPDGLLGYIPFEVLVTNRPEKNTNFGSHDYLIRDFQISYAYSATLLKEMQDKQHRKTSGNLLAFAPSFSNNENLIAENRSIENTRQGLGPLKYNIPEVKAINQLVGGKVYEGIEATEETFTQVANQYKIIHLATHGKANDKAGDYSFLAFAEVEDSIENELLYVRDLYNLELNADLVVLSACETGVGELQRGEGIVSLARGFSYAGAKSIITSLWSVNDASTKELMESFYIYLLDGKTKDKALRQAKLDYLQSHPNEEVHPFFWGAFIAVGDMEAIPVGQEINWLWAIFGIGLLAFTLYWFRFRKR